jgi:PKD repeat protein
MNRPHPIGAADGSLPARIPIRLALALLGCLLASLAGASTVAAKPRLPAALRSAYAAGRGVPRADVGALRPGSLRVATSPSSGARWAIAGFLPRRSGGPRAWDFQGGRGHGSFTRRRGGSWRLVSFGGRARCLEGLPAWARKALGLGPASGCAEDRASTAAARAAARQHGRTSIPERIAAIALSQVGVHGTPVAHDFSLDCNPYTPLVGPTIPNSDGCGYDGSFGVQDQNEAWCADFTKWIWERAGVSDELDTINAGAASFYAWGQNRGEQMPVDPTDPAVGDAVAFFPSGPISANGAADHVGIVTAIHANGTVDMVNGDFLDTRTGKIGVEFDTKLDLATWAPAIWGKGEQWVFVSPPEAAPQPAPSITSLRGPSRAAASTESRFRAHAVQRGGSIASYVWSFGDGGSAIGANVSHVFRNPGWQTVTVTATSNLGTVRSRHLSVHVVSASASVANTPEGAASYTTQPVRQQLFGLSAGGALTAQESTTGGTWSVRALPGRPSAASAVAALNYAGSSYRMTQHVYFRSAGGALAETSGHGSTWKTATVGGRLAPSSPIVAALTDAGSGLVPHVFSVSRSGRLTEAVRRRSRWSFRTLPGKPSPTTSLATAVVVRSRAVQVHLFYLDRRGRLQDDVLTGSRWRRRRAPGSPRPAPDSSLAAAAFGPDGDVIYVFFLSRAGALRDSTLRGHRWRSRRLPGRPARSSRLLAQTYLPASVTAAATRLGLGVFYLTAAGDPATTSYAPTTSRTPRWAASTLGGSGDALLGASAYPDGVQGQQLFYRSGTAVYDNAYTPVNGSWYPGLMPGSAASP